MRTNKGFTLIEMLLVVAVLAILSAVAIPIFSSTQETARESVCLANRRTLLSVVYADYYSGNHATLAASFTSVYDAGKYVCPDGGHFSCVSDSETTGHIVCDYHGTGDSGGSVDSGSTGDSGGSSATFPGSFTINPSYWPLQTAFTESNTKVTVSPGGIFQYSDGNYYIVSQSIVLQNKVQAGKGPGDGSAYSTGASHKITGKIVTFSSDSEQKSGLSRGDICQVGNTFYVFVSTNQTVAYSPTVSSDSWYKIPS